jgi:hypothetical protein
MQGFVCRCWAGRVYCKAGVFVLPSSRLCICMCMPGTVTGVLPGAFRGFEGFLGVMAVENARFSAWASTQCIAGALQHNSGPSCVW